MVATRVILAFVLSSAFISASTPLVFAQATGVTQATGNFDNKELSDGVKQVGWPNFAWPTITMPKITMPKFPPLWPSNSDGNSPALLSPFMVGYAKVSAGAKKTWEGTKDLFSVFQSTETSTPTRRVSKPKPSFWQRLTTREQETKAPQTVGEFMKQPRLNP